MIKIENLSKTFRGGIHALRSVSATFSPGKTTVIIGPSGSGKSTLLRTLNLLEIPTEGTIQIEEDELTFPRKVTKQDKEKLRSHSAMIFQSYNLFPHLTVQENVSLAPTIHGANKNEMKEKALKILGQVGLEDKTNSYPAELSGGQAQRAAIARALALQPQYLYCDEPTSALDPELAAEVSRVLTRLANDGQGLIVVTHDMNFARRVADKILFLIDGEIRFDGKPKDFFDSTDERIVRFLSVFDPSEYKPDFSI
ncbi:hypothetical protein HMPREF9306_01540 [Propionimicrobium lymphophilum ACS-093-V-SCH5]|uniref:ABC transporter domain-containing protein n=1 Tax=Propionimicrobium lymphophilum ACS-093-V-SCH5 TaxID=883161 RepID=S2WH49_9ACTN|nr:ATP-binding cassette domain-containing protein [Propionimicrobium lymphophilum]EPD31982.1 hypothetical protein HMPREF9306_01540 [Propionimicrobium lymphophilum ACS-093-V-SCH5]